MSVSQEEIIRASFLRHRSVLEKTQNDLISHMERGARMLHEAILAGNKFLICGNGGSAADSEHFAGEWLCRYREDRNPIPAISLVSDVATLTAISNDYDFESVFSRQVKALGKEGDVLVAFTTSGQSKNIILAVEEAKKIGMKTIVLTGQKGKNLAESASLGVVIPSDETARIQEMHELVYHIWCELVDDLLRAH